tara:strand:- start:1065 stop:1358 length:294 start_codon:yes stop_codon:yes gene_type:complete
MNTLEILKAKINLKTVLIKFKESIEELKAKHPGRKDLINSMKESAEDIEHFQSVFRDFEIEYYLECKLNLRNQIIIAEHKHEIDKLKEIINDAKLEL